MQNHSKFITFLAAKTSQSDHENMENTKHFKFKELSDTLNPNQMNLTHTAGVRCITPVVNATVNRFNSPAQDQKV